MTTAVPRGDGEANDGLIQTDEPVSLTPDEEAALANAPPYLADRQGRPNYAEMPAAEIVADLINPILNVPPAGNGGAQQFVYNPATPLVLPDGQLLTGLTWGNGTAGTVTYTATFTAVGTTTATVPYNWGTMYVRHTAPINAQDGDIWFYDGGFRGYRQPPDPPEIRPWEVEQAPRPPLPPARERRRQALAQQYADWRRRSERDAVNWDECDDLTARDKRHLRRLGYLPIRSPGYPGRVYRIPPRAYDQVQIIERRRHVANLCLQPRDYGFTAPQWVGLQKTLLLADEERYLRSANHFTRDSMYMPRDADENPPETRYSPNAGDDDD